MDPRDAFQSVLSSLKAEFPWLVVQEVAGHPHVESVVELPVQAGLSFPIQLNLQNHDELHLVASSLWVEWFPCTDSHKLQAFTNAVVGLVGGQFEIAESLVFGKPVAAVLRPRHGRGEALATWSTLWALLPLPRQHRVVANASAA